MNLEQLRATVSAGGVENVTLRGRGDSFFVEIATRSGQQATLARVRGPEPRSFINPRSGLGMLREAGVFNVTVDLTDWEPLKK
ncbi:hypothetical protein [Xylophilus sp. GOD-11R]|uniref:hypothetical protein n=1 Tax=Xylophilus sp. GOD-11R TaxID=3089814 RepID=UPI00298CBE10|nr:hypothetical protein [Xylophilus sp. GOD-11R]WPB56468.1 hypothetical protein R9X41_20355 [Xylophilus sp. GOD-11R]